MAMFAYKSAMFLIFLNLSADIVNFIADFLFPYSVVRIPTLLVDLGFLNGLGNIAALSTGAAAAGLLLFSFMPVTLAFIIGLFGTSIILTGFMLALLPIPFVFKAMIIMIVAITNIVGIVQYASRSSLQGQ